MVCFFMVYILYMQSAILAQQPVQTIRGTVTDVSNSAPVAFAGVMLLNTDPAIGSVTDLGGNFLIPNIPVGRYDIMVSYIGYEPVIIREILVTSARETVLEISLRQRITTMDEIIVTPKINKQQPVNRMALASARMLSVEEAGRYAGGFDDPARLASAFAGVTSGVASNAIVVRGNAPKSLQWKLEGIEIPNPNHFADLNSFGGGGLTALSSQMLANSDFFTGAFPAQYTNALSGVFDITMRTGNNINRQHTFQAGIIGIDLASEGPFRTYGNSSYLFNYRYSTLSLIMPLLPEEAQGTRYQDMAFKFNFPTQRAGSFSLWGIGLSDRSSQQALTDPAQWIYKQNREQEDALQFMGAMGLRHQFFPGNRTHMNSTLAATVSGLDWTQEWLNDILILQPQNRIGHQNWNLVLTSTLNTRFNTQHQNVTGLTVTGLIYNMLLEEKPETGTALIRIVDENGFSTLISAHSGSVFVLTDDLELNLGLASQYFTLNKRWTIEPRAGIKWQVANQQQIGIAYGLHSRLERLNTYFTRSPDYGHLINKNLDFTKAHHFVISYDFGITEKHYLKIEPYYQYLFDVPVIPGSTFSLINLLNEWFITDQLKNDGNGRNYGVDVTLERYLSGGHYYMLTGSLFRSEYRTDEKTWRNTRYNRTIAVNFLVGKEWFLGASGQNVLGFNFRASLIGGDRHAPVNHPASVDRQEVVYDEFRAFSEQLSPNFLIHITTSYMMNRQKSTHQVAMKILNATMVKDFYGHRYNFIENRVNRDSEAIIVPNLSYKIEF